jgi:hypothetical protein
MFRTDHRIGLVAAAGVALLACSDDQSVSQPALAASSSCTSESTLAAPMTEIASVTLPARPLVLGKRAVSLPLTAPGDRATAQRLASIARSGTETVILHLNCVQADRQPGATWEVYVGLPAGTKPSGESPHFVGNVALFGDGVKSEAQEPFAEFIFPLDRAIAASPDASALTVTFVPSSGVVGADGRLAPADVKAPVRIGEMKLLLDKPQQ